MSNPRKVTVDLDLLNNQIVNVSAIRSPQYKTDFGKGLLVPSKIDIEAPSAESNPGRILVHTGDKGTLDLYTGSYNKEALSAINSIRLTSTASKGERFDSHSHYTLKVRDLITVKGNRDQATTTLDTVNEKLASTFRNTELATRETAKSTINNNLSKTTNNKAVVADQKVGAGASTIAKTVDAATAELPNIELLSKPGTSVDIISNDQSIYHLYVNATATQSTAKLDNLVTTSRIIQQGKTSFTNATQNDIRANKKLDIYTPALFISTKTGNVKFIESTTDTTSITVDNETVTTELTSQTKSTLAGHTYITAKPSGKSYLEATVATINIGKTSSTQNSESLVNKTITDVNVLSTNVDETASSSYTLSAPKTFRITAGYGKTTKTLLESASSTSPQNNRSTLNIDNINSNDLKDTQNLKGKFELDVNKTNGNGDNHAQVDAKNINLFLEDNKFTLKNTTEITTGKGDALDLAAEATGSHIYMGQSTYGVKPPSGVQGIHISSNGKGSQISAQKMSAETVHIQPSGSVNIDSPVSISQPITFDGGDAGNIIQAIGAENLKIETAKGRTTVTGKDITVHSAYGDLLTTDSSKTKSTLKVSDGTFDKHLTSSTLTNLNTKTEIDGVTSITGTSLNVTPTNVIIGKLPNTSTVLTTNVVSDTETVTRTKSLTTQINNVKVTDVSTANINTFNHTVTGTTTVDHNIDVVDVEDLKLYAGQSTEPQLESNRTLYIEANKSGSRVHLDNAEVDANVKLHHQLYFPNNSGEETEVKADSKLDVVAPNTTLTVKHNGTVDYKFLEAANGKLSVNTDDTIVNTLLSSTTQSNLNGTTNIKGATTISDGSLAVTAATIGIGDGASSNLTTNINTIKETVKGSKTVSAGSSSETVTGLHEEVYGSYNQQVTEATTIKQNTTDVDIKSLELYAGNISEVKAENNRALYIKVTPTVTGESPQTTVAAHSFVHLDDAKVDNNIELRHQLYFPNDSNENTEIKANKKLNIATPNVALKVKHGESLDYNFLEANNGALTVLTDRATINTQLASSKQTNLTGNVDIVGDTGKYLDVNTPEINVGFDNSTKQKSAAITNVRTNVLTANHHVKTETKNVTGVSTLIYNKGVDKDVAVLKLAAESSKPTAKRVSLEVDNIKTSDLYGNVSLNGVVDVDVTSTASSGLPTPSNHFNVNATKATLNVKDNSITVDQNGVSFISTTTGNNQSTVFKTSPAATFGANNTLYTEYSNVGGKVTSQIGANDASFKNLTIREEGSVTSNSNIELHNNVTFKDGTGARTIYGKDNLAIDVTSKLTSKASTTEITSPVFTLQRTGDDKILEVTGSTETANIDTVNSTSITVDGVTTLKNKVVIENSSKTDKLLNVTIDKATVTSKQIAIGSKANVTTDNTVNIATKTIKLDDTKNISGTESYDGTTTIVSDNLDIDARQFSLSSTGHAKDILTWGATTSDSSLNVNKATIDTSTTLTGNVSTTIKPNNSFSITTKKNTDNGEAKAGSITYSDSGLVIDESNTLHLNSTNKTFALGSNTETAYGTKGVVVARVDNDGSKISADNIKSTTQLTANDLTASGKINLANPTITSGGITFNAVDPTISTAGKLTIKSTGSNTNGVLLQADNNKEDKVEILANSSVAKLDTITATKSLTSDTSSVLTGSHVSFNGTGLNVNAEVKNTGNLVDIKYTKDPANSEINIKAKFLNINNDTTTVSIGKSGTPINTVNEYVTNLTQEVSTVDLHTNGASPGNNQSIGKYMSISNAGNKSSIRASHVDTNTTNVSDKLTVGNASIYWDVNTNSLVVSV